MKPLHTDRVKDVLTKWGVPGNQEAKRVADLVDQVTSKVVTEAVAGHSDREAWSELLKAADKAGMKILTEEEQRIWHEGRGDRKRAAKKIKSDQRALAELRAGKPSEQTLGRFWMMEHYRCFPSQFVHDDESEVKQVQGDCEWNKPGIACVA